MIKYLNKYLPHARRLTALAFTIFLAQMSQTFMGMSDVIMAGRVGATDMASIGVANSIWQPLILFGNGLLLALPPTISYLNSSGQRNLIAHQVRQGIWLVIVCCLILGIAIHYSYIIIDYMHTPANLAQITNRYLKIMLLGMPGYLLYINFRGLNDGLAKTKPAMVIAFLGLSLNIPLNYIFIYGKFGAPALGAVGCGVASATVNWMMGLMMISYCRSASSQRDLKLFKPLFEKPDFYTLRKLCYLGIPIAAAIGSEVMLFAISSLILAPLGAEVVASHQVALTSSGFLFIFPLSFGMASTIIIGQRLGEKNYNIAKHTSYLAIGISLCCAVVLATFIYFFRGDIAGLIASSNNPQVIHMATNLLLFTTLYQFSDCLQVTTTGVLRGYKDTRSILFITTFCYWCIGIPLGYSLARTNWIVPAMGASGFWVAFIVTLTVAALLLIARLLYIQRLPNDELLRRLK